MSHIANPARYYVAMKRFSCNVANYRSITLWRTANRRCRLTDRVHLRLQNRLIYSREFLSRHPSLIRISNFSFFFFFFFVLTLGILWLCRYFIDRKLSGLSFLHKIIRQCPICAVTVNSLLFGLALTGRISVKIKTNDQQKNYWRVLRWLLVVRVLIKSTKYNNNNKFW